METTPKKVTRREKVAVRVARLTKARPESAAAEGVLYLNRGYFTVERLRVRAGAKAKKKTRGAMRGKRG
jgi:hypothetical protein